MEKTQECEERWLSVAGGVTVSAEALSSAASLEGSKSRKGRGSGEQGKRGKQAADTQKRILETLF